MLPFLTCATAAALASASTATIKESTNERLGNTLPTLHADDFCFVEDKVWTPTKESGRVILYDSCILRITVDMTGLVSTSGDGLGTEEDKCTVRFHTDGEGQGWVYRGAMKWKAVQIPFNDAVHVSVLGHRDNACTLEFMPTKIDGGDKKCPTKSCPKSFFRVTTPETHADTRCCDACQKANCDIGKKLKTTFDGAVENEQDCCTEICKPDGCDVNAYLKDVYRRQKSDDCCEVCPNKCAPAHYPFETTEKKKSLKECCAACEECTNSQYAVHDGLTCCEECKCEPGTFLNAGIKKFSPDQCCEACPAKCPEGKYKTTNPTSISNCCSDCEKCEEAKQYEIKDPADGTCCGTCTCSREAGKYYKKPTGAVAKEDDCCGDCPADCGEGRRRVRVTGEGAELEAEFESAQDCCEDIEATEQCAKSLKEEKPCPPGSYPNPAPKSAEDCCTSCETASCDNWQTINLHATSESDCCMALTKAAFCGTDQFACPQGQFPKPEYSIASSEAVTHVGGEGLMLTAVNASSEKMSSADSEQTRDKMCCKGCDTCSGTQIKNNIPATVGDCCKDCGECGPKQYKNALEGGHADASTCCQACDCGAGCYWKDLEGPVGSSDGCCVECPDCGKGAKKVGGGPFENQEGCCTAQTWEEYCGTLKGDFCGAGSYRFIQDPSGKASSNDDEAKTNCCKECKMDMCASGQYLDSVTPEKTSEDQCCKPCSCVDDQFFMLLNGVAENEDKCCGACPADDAECGEAQMRVTGGSFPSKDECCRAQTWGEYCPGLDNPCGEDSYSYREIAWPDANANAEKEQAKTHCCKKCNKCEVWQDAKLNPENVDACCKAKKCGDDAFSSDLKTTCAGGVLDEPLAEDKMIGTTPNPEFCCEDTPCEKLQGLCPEEKPMLIGKAGDAGNMITVKIKADVPGTCCREKTNAEKCEGKKCDDNHYRDDEDASCCKACTKCADWQKMKEKPTSADDCCEAQECDAFSGSLDCANGIKENTPLTEAATDAYCCKEAKCSVLGNICPAGLMFNKDAADVPVLTAQAAPEACCRTMTCDDVGCDVAAFLKGGQEQNVGRVRLASVTSDEDNPFAAKKAEVVDNAVKVINPASAADQCCLMCDPTKCPPRSYPKEKQESMTDCCEKCPETCETWQTVNDHPKTRDECCQAKTCDVFTEDKCAKGVRKNTALTRKANAEDCCEETPCSELARSCTGARPVLNRDAADTKVQTAASVLDTCCRGKTDSERCEGTTCATDKYRDDTADSCCTACGPCLAWQKQSLSSGKTAATECCEAETCDKFSENLGCAKGDIKKGVKLTETAMVGNTPSHEVCCEEATCKGINHVCTGRMLRADTTKVRTKAEAPGKCCKECLPCEAWQKEILNPASKGACCEANTCGGFSNPGCIEFDSRKTLAAGDVQGGAPTPKACCKAVECSTQEAKCTRAGQGLKDGGKATVLTEADVLGKCCQEKTCADYKCGEETTSVTGTKGGPVKVPMVARKGKGNEKYGKDTCCEANKLAEDKEKIFCPEVIGDGIKWKLCDPDIEFPITKYTVQVESKSAGTMNDEKTQENIFAASDVLSAHKNAIKKGEVSAGAAKAVEHIQSIARALGQVPVSEINVVGQFKKREPKALGTWEPGTNRKGIINPQDLKKMVEINDKINPWLRALGAGRAAFVAGTMLAKLRLASSADEDTKTAVKNFLDTAVACRSVFTFQPLPPGPTPDEEECSRLQNGRFEKEMPMGTDGKRKLQLEIDKLIFA